jgi:predicted  nucleic acid-binding Zn-ribbon protein
MSDADADASEADLAELTQLRSEVERLRVLVGPTEASYDDLRQDLLAARDAARDAEAAAGRLRGEVAELNVALVRARQDQEHLHRIVKGRLRSSLTGYSRTLRARFF